jgi:hypothetical protein
MNVLKTSKDVLLLDISNIFHVGNLGKLKDPAEQYKAKFATFRLVKFDPFVLSCTIVASPPHSDTLYWKTKFQGLIQERAILEVGSEREAFNLKNYLVKKQLVRVLQVTTQHDVKVDNLALS